MEQEGRLGEWQLLVYYLSTAVFGRPGDLAMLVGCPIVCNMKERVCLTCAVSVRRALFYGPSTCQRTFLRCEHLVKTTFPFKLLPVSQAGVLPLEWFEISVGREYRVASQAIGEEGQADYLLQAPRADGYSAAHSGLSHHQHTNGSAMNGVQPGSYTSSQDPTARPIDSSHSQTGTQEAAGTWGEPVDDGATFFDDSPAESAPAQPTGTNVGTEQQSFGGPSTSAPGHEAPQGVTAQSGQHADPAWRSEPSGGSPNVSPFTALSSEVPSDWYNQQEVPLRSFLLRLYCLCLTC